jgi:hypothetical protein
MAHFLHEFCLMKYAIFVAEMQNCPLGATGENSILQNGYFYLVEKRF